MPCINDLGDAHVEMLTDVALSVLQAMVFAMGEKSVDKPQFEAGDYLLTQIAYCGDRNGQLAIMAPKPLCREWAALMTGDDSESQLYDALGEVTNTIGGNWLTQAFSAGQAIKLQPPITAAADQSHWDRLLNSPTSSVLLVDGSLLVLHVKTLD